MRFRVLLSMYQLQGWCQARKAVMYHIMKISKTCLHFNVFLGRRMERIRRLPALRAGLNIFFRRGFGPQRLAVFIQKISTIGMCKCKFENSDECEAISGTGMMQPSSFLTAQGNEDNAQKHSMKRHRDCISCVLQDIHRAPTRLTDPLLHLQYARREPGQRCRRAQLDRRSWFL